MFSHDNIEDEKTPKKDSDIKKLDPSKTQQMFSHDKKTPSSNEE